MYPVFPVLFLSFSQSEFPFPSSHENSRTLYSFSWNSVLWMPSKQKFSYFVFIFTQQKSNKYFPSLVFSVSVTFYLIFSAISSEKTELLKICSVSSILFFRLCWLLVGWWFLFCIFENAFSYWISFSRLLKCFSRRGCCLKNQNWLFSFEISI